MGGLIVSMLIYGNIIFGLLIWVIVGDEIVVLVINCLGDLMLVYWYGIVLCNDMDGIEFVIVNIGFGGDFMYWFFVLDLGIYWVYLYVGF